MNDNKEVEQKGFDIKAFINNKDAVIRIGVMLSVVGFILGYAASYISEYDATIGAASMDIAKIIIMAGIALVCYYFLRFVNVDTAKILGMKSESKDVVKTIEPSEPEVQVDTKNSMFCPSCGKQISKTSTFCLHCGKQPKEIVQTEEVSEEVPEEEPEQPKSEE